MHCFMPWSSNICPLDILFDVKGLGVHDYPVSNDTCHEPLDMAY